MDYVELTADQRGFFDANGYLIVPGARGRNHRRRHGDRRRDNGTPRIRGLLPALPRRLTREDSKGCKGPNGIDWRIASGM